MLKKFFQNTRKPKGRLGRLMARMMNRGHARLSAWGLSHVSPDPKSAVLDIGCGGGANLNFIRSLCPGGIITGLDYSPICVEESIRNNQNAVNEGTCRVIQGDASCLPFEDEDFHLVTAFETVYFWPHLISSFRQIFRVLKPGGILLICNEEGNPSNDRWTKLIEGMKIYNSDELASMLKEAGFSRIKTDLKRKDGWLCLTAVKEHP